jgi:hypothetical protein
MTFKYKQLIMKKNLFKIIRLTAPHNIQQMLNMTFKAGNGNRSKSSC